MRNLVMSLVLLVMFVCSAGLLILTGLDHMAIKPTMSNHWLAYVMGGYGIVCLSLLAHVWLTPVVKPWNRYQREFDEDSLKDI